MTAAPRICTGDQGACQRGLGSERGDQQLQHAGRVRPAGVVQLPALALTRSRAMRRVVSGRACLHASRDWRGITARRPRCHAPRTAWSPNGVYANTYFDLSYPLPAGWTQDLTGPAPSTDGYYVLASLGPGRRAHGTILIAAQDLFFAAATLDDAAEAAREFARVDRQGRRHDDRPAADAGRDRRPDLQPGRFQRRRPVIAARSSPTAAAIW